MESIAMKLLKTLNSPMKEEIAAYLKRRYAQKQEVAEILEDLNLFVKTLESLPSGVDEEYLLSIYYGMTSWMKNNSGIFT
ncbi:MAG: hypothetical protein ACK5MW_02935 [Enterococcus sp.]